MKLSSKRVSVWIMVVMILLLLLPIHAKANAGVLEMTIIDPSAQNQYTNEQIVTVCIEGTAHDAIQEALPIKLALNGVQIANETVMVDFANERTMNYTFTTKIDLSAMGDYTLAVMLDEGGIYETAANKIVSNQDGAPVATGDSLNAPTATSEILPLLVIEKEENEKIVAEEMAPIKYGARATYTVTYEPNGGAGTPYVIAGLTENDTHTVMAPDDENIAFTAPSPNHIFVGWNSAADRSGDAYPLDTPISIDSNKTLYAMWRLVPPNNCLAVESSLFASIPSGGEGNAPMTFANTFEGAINKAFSAMWLYYGTSDTLVENITGLKVVIYAVDTSGNPTGETLYTQTINPSSLTPGEWNRIALTTPYVATTDSFAMGLYFEKSGKAYPVGMASGSGGKSFVFSNGEWKSLGKTNGGDLMIRTEYASLKNPNLSLGVSPVSLASVGTEVTLTAALNGSATGILTFKANGKELAVLDIAIDGTAFSYVPDIGEYTYVVEYSGDNAYTSDVANASLKITKKAQAAVPKMMVDSVTQKSIALVAEAGVEYSLDGIVWQNSPVFEGLTVGTTYTLFARFAETEYVEAGSIATAKITTLAADVLSPSVTPSPSVVPSPSVSPSTTQDSKIPKTGDDSTLSLFAFIALCFAFPIGIGWSKKIKQGAYNK